MTLSRRELLAAGIALTAAACTGQADPTNGTTADTSGPATSTTATTQAPTTTTKPVPVLAPAFSGPSPFALGIASGDPDATSVVLWTRLLTDIEGAPFDGDLEVAIDISRDEAFTDLAHSSIAPAPAQYANSVHFLAMGLDEDTCYWYRFRIGDHTSPVGRTRTVPASGDRTLRFGFSSCQNWESGTYAAHRHLAATDLDLFVWLGDYIYEYGPGNGGVVSSSGQRVHNSPEVETLEAYRARYALYKSDSDLQAHHASRPWLITWDDHEVDNNHAGLATEDDQDRATFEQRRHVAHQAWWEHMPVRLDPPTGVSDFRIYRSTSWGSLVDLHMLDGRQYRDPQPTDGEPLVLPGVGDLGIRLLGPTATDPTHSMLGAEQRSWLEAQVTSSTATWNVLGNQVYMHGLNAFPGDVPATNTDTWDGYFGERKDLLEVLTANSENLIVLSGDFHAASGGDLRADPFDLQAPVIATEFMAPAISSAFPDNLRNLAPLVLGINPQVRHFTPENGYMICEVTSAAWTTEIHVLADRTLETSSVSLDTTLRVNAGAAGITSIS